LNVYGDQPKWEGLQACTPTCTICSHAALPHYQQLAWEAGGRVCRYAYTPRTWSIEARSTIAVQLVRNGGPSVLHLLLPVFRILQRGRRLHLELVKSVHPSRVTFRLKLLQNRQRRLYHPLRLKITMKPKIRFLTIQLTLSEKMRMMIITIVSIRFLSDWVKSK